MPDNPTPESDTRMTLTYVIVLVVEAVIVILLWRFGVRTRTLASFLFLMGRVFSLGVVLSAPAVVISAILGWTLPSTVLLIGVPTVVYTSIGGVQAVAWTDVKQMFVIVAAMIVAI